MKTMYWAFALVFGLAILGSGTELTAQAETEKQVETAVIIGAETTDVTGTWEIVTTTPRGTRNGTFRIVAEEGGLMGYGERGNFPITQDGNVLRWSATVNSPRGAIEVRNTAEVNGDAMEGTVEMLSGPMSGRSLAFTGTRER
ncbi:MAG: hypothetical protein AAFP77_10680 [Bacteroidota bacterium]